MDRGIGLPGLLAHIIADGGNPDPLPAVPLAAVEGMFAGSDLFACAMPLRPSLRTNCQRKFRSVKIAEEEAVAKAYAEGIDSGSAEINAVAPNYPPAQLMYAYAIENVLKGLIVLRRSELIQECKLNDELVTHDLIEFAEMADFTVFVQERPILAALSQLSYWAGRYPVARNSRPVCWRAES